MVTPRVVLDAMANESPIQWKSIKINIKYHIVMVVPRVVHGCHGQRKSYPMKSVKINVHIVMVTPRVVIDAMAHRVAITKRCVTIAGCSLSPITLLFITSHLYSGVSRSRFIAVSQHICNISCKHIRKMKTPLHPTYILENWGLSGSTLFPHFALNIDSGYSLSVPTIYGLSKNKKI